MSLLTRIVPGCVQMVDMIMKEGQMQQQLVTDAEVDGI